MKAFSFICPLFIFCITSSSHSSEVPSNGLGIAVCDTRPIFSKSECKTKDPSPGCFPPECTSFYYTGLDLSNGTAVELNLNDYPEGYLDSLLALNKPVTVCICRENWIEDVKCIKQNGAETEVALLKNFFDQHKGITGLALFQLELSAEDKEDPEYSQNLINYIGILRKNFPEMKIGLFLRGYMIINTLDTPQLKSLDLTCLEPNVDFFRIITVLDKLVAECSPDYVHGDVVMNKYNKLVLDYISGLNISKEKIVWDVWGTPTNNENLKECDLTYTNMCLKPNDRFCAETQQRLYDKAKYIKEIAGGFALNYIDWDDINCGCQCDRQFPVFYALWDGFNGNSVPKECSLMDRPNL